MSMPAYENSCAGIQLVRSVSLETNLNITPSEPTNVCILGVAHRASQADEYEGYHIPEGISRSFPLMPDNSRITARSNSDKQYLVYPAKHQTVASLMTLFSRAMTHDPNVYHDPDEFRPERFLPSLDGETPRNDKSAMAFGFGRRICPGRHMAESSLFIYMACTLAAFNISKVIDVDGHLIEPKIKWVSGIIT